jgi:hypothetical protein
MMSSRLKRLDLSTAPPKSTPSLPTLKSLRAPEDQIDPAELNAFLQIFGEEK